MQELVGKSIRQLKSLLSGKQVTAREVLDAHLKHLQATEPDIEAFNTVTEDLARKQADDIDGKIARGEALPALGGIPIALKDNINVQGCRTTCSSKILENYVSPFNATVTERLFAAGAVCLGKTNMDEFAMGSSTENSAFKKTRNPWDKRMVPGGSSGGSTAAVAAGSAVIALGSDTGGSIREPASFCGVVGMKPTYGAVSRFGLVAFASSLDQIGPLGRSVEDVAVALSVISGHDPKDSTSLDQPPQQYSAYLKTETDGLRIGVIKELIGEGIDPEVREAILAAVETYKTLGAAVEECTMPNINHALPVYYLLATAEASANLARYDGVRYGLRDKQASDTLSMYFNSRHEGFGPEVKRRIMLGTYALSSGYYDAYYKKAQQVRRLIKDDFDRAFKNFDVLICPTVPTAAFELGAKMDDPLQMYLSDIATIPANLAGLPGVSLPCGFTKSGLPIGLQLLGPALGDATLLHAGYAFEQATKFHQRPSPPLSGVAARS